MLSAIGGAEEGRLQAKFVENDNCYSITLSLPSSIVVRLQIEQPIFLFIFTLFFLPSLFSSSWRFIVDEVGERKNTQRAASESCQEKKLNHFLSRFPYFVTRALMDEKARKE